MKKGASPRGNRPIGYHHLDHPTKPLLPHESTTPREMNVRKKEITSKAAVGVARTSGTSSSRVQQNAAHVKYKALHPLSKAFILSMFMRIDLNNIWKKVFSMRRYFDYWKWCSAQLAFVEERIDWEKRYHEMKTDLEEQIREGQELALMQKAESLTREVLYEEYIEGMRRAKVFMVKTDKTRRRVVFSYAWIQWQNLVYVKQMAEEQEKLRLDTEQQEGMADEEILRAQREAAARLAEMNVEQMKGMHKIHHILLIQEKRQLRFKCLRFLLHWHIKALCMRYKDAYVNTVDPLRAHIEYQEKLLQRVEEDISNEMGRRRSTFKPALMRTGLGERNALKVAAVRLRESKKGPQSIEDLHHSYSDRARTQAKVREGKSQPHHHPDLSQVEAMRGSYLPYSHPGNSASATTTPVRSQFGPPEKEMLASAPSSAAPHRRQQQQAPTSSSRTAASNDVYYGMDELWREHGMQGLEEVKRSDEDEDEGEGEEDMGMGFGGGGVGSGGERIRWDPPEDTSDWWTRDYLRENDKNAAATAEEERDRSYGESAAAIDIYDAILHPHSRAEKAERARIASEEKKRRIRRLQGALSRAYTNGPAAAADAAEVARYGSKGMVFRGRHAVESGASYTASGGRPDVRKTRMLHDLEVSRSQRENHLVVPSSRGKDKAGVGLGRGVQLAISSPVRINDFSIQMNLDIDELQERDSVGSLDSDEYHGYNNEALDDGWGHEVEVVEESARAASMAVQQGAWTRKLKSDKHDTVSTSSSSSSSSYSSYSSYDSTE